MFVHCVEKGLQKHLAAWSCRQAVYRTYEIEPWTETVIK